MARFGRILSAMITPFTEAGDLDVDGAAVLARWLVEQGNEGLVVAGTTGEAPTLSDAEKLELWRAVVEAVDVPVVAGTSSNDTAHSVELTAAASALGVAGILAVTPYYNRPSQAGIEAHFRALAAATALPVMLYDIPVRTGRKVSTEVMLRLAHGVTNIVALKDAAADPSATAELIAAAPAEFEVYSGDDRFTLPLLSVGAVGTVGVATHWAAPQVREMFDAWEAGDVVAARQANATLLDSYRFETSDEAPNPVPAKAMMRLLGQPAGRCRAPMGPEPDGFADRARAVAAGLGLGVSA